MPTPKHTDACAHKKGKKKLETCPLGLIFEASLATTHCIEGEKVARNWPEKWNSTRQTNYHPWFPIGNALHSFAKE